MLNSTILRHSLSTATRPLPSTAFGLVRFNSRYQAFDTAFDPEELSAARSWYQSFGQDSLPKGNTTYSRSSGPGGQHVNKTESKATTTWSVAELTALLPRLMHATVRSSKYYSKRNDSILIQAQTQRSRSANADENRQKLFDELVSMYQQAIPNETANGKKQKHDAIEKSFHAHRIHAKKQQSSKKQSRKGGGCE